MPTPNIDTLQKLQFTSMDDFLDALNANFAVIQNSPLYKGIPGNLGGTGGTGLTGTRGSEFIFVSLAPFQAQFPGELQALSDITLVYINSKLGNFDDTQKLIAALGTDQFVNKDVIVTSDTEMLSYDFGTNLFVDTGIAFNTQTSLANSIQQLIQNYVASYISNDPTISEIQNVFSGFVTYGKNYPDTNNTFTTSSITSSTVYSPYIPGYNSQIGVPVTNHKYFGFEDDEWPTGNSGTIVFGSIKHYYDMLMATVSTDGNNTLNSAFAPGVNNVPAGVFMHDTQNNGVMIGYKGSPNLRAFASMYKNDVGEFVIQSDQGAQASEYSQLLLHADYLKYAKLVQFLNDLQLTGDFIGGGDLATKGINTGKYTQGANSGNGYNSKVTEVGNINAGSVTKQIAQTEQWPNYPTAVLVTGSDGTVAKNYVLETAVENVPDEIDLAQITVIPAAPTSILTSNYFAFLANKINNISAYATNNYWRKNQFDTGEIPALNVSAELTSGGDTSLTAGMLVLQKNANIATLTAQQFVDNSVTKQYGFFKGNVFVTDSLGNLSKVYSLDAEVLDPAEIVGGVDLTIYSASQDSIISTYHYAHLAQKINSSNAYVAANSWFKSQWNNFTIPSLALSGDLRNQGNVDFAPNGGASVFHIDEATGTMTLGSATSPVVIATNALTLNALINKVLTTNGAGLVTGAYGFETAQYATADQAGNNPVTVNVNSGTNLATSANVGWVVTKLNNFMAWVSANFWTRTQLSNGSVGAIRATTSLRADTILQTGASTDPTLFSNGTALTLGKSNGVTTIRGSVVNFVNMPSKVLVTDASGNLISTYSVETAKPVYTAQSDITANYWASGASTFDIVANSANKFVTSDMFAFILNNLNSVRALIFNRPTYAELNTLVPSGAILMWTNKMGAVPSNWTICDGRLLGGSTTIHTDNMINVFVKGSLTPGTAGGNPTNQLVIVKANLPNITIPVTVASAGAHTHTMASAGDHTHTYIQTEVGIDFGDSSTRSSWTAADTQNTGVAGAHVHVVNSAGAHVHTAATAALGSGTAASIEPNSYTVIFIMKN